VFLTATPWNKGQAILDNQVITYKIQKEDIEGDIIRKSEFKLIPEHILDSHGACDLTPGDYREIGRYIKDILEGHDAADSSVLHKAMILVNRVDTAKEVAECIPQATFCTTGKEAKQNTEDFENNEYRIIVVCGMLTEGYDHNPISVCAILRNLRSPVLFQQFIGRSWRRSSDKDPVVAQILSLERFGQKNLWDTMGTLAEKDPGHE
jgi:superfamily II DNA or RNA helicase